ncbi:MAG: hypothetical protein AB9866_24735 [Syntrophobacteraceae bacterium]
MNVHLWTKTGNARRLLVFLFICIGLTFGMHAVSVAQQQEPGVSPAAKTGKIPNPPAAPAQTSAPLETPQAQAPMAADSTPPDTPGAQAPAVADSAAPAPPAQQQSTPLVADSAVLPASNGSDKPESTCPPEYLPLVQKTTAALMTSNFSFHPVKALDPFIPFLLPEVPPIQLSEEGEVVKSDKPLTPLQQMTIAEIERGLKAITWGDLGKKAVIEDSTGKGFIVGIGTPAGERSGVITQIQKDRLIIQQQVWDRMAKKHFPQDVIVKLSKKSDEQKDLQAPEGQQTN